MENINDVISNVEEIQRINKEIIMSGIHEDITKEKANTVQIERLKELATELNSKKLYNFNLESDAALLKSVKEFCSTY